MIAFLGFMFAAAVANGPDADAARELSNRARKLYDSAQYAQAEPLYRQAVSKWSKLGPQATMERAIDLRNLGGVLRATGHYRDAEPLLTEALRDLEATDADSVEVERALFNLASLYRSEGELTKAESYGLNALRLVEKRTDVSVAERHAPHAILASIYIEEKRFADAEALLKTALEGADGPIAATSYNLLSMVAISRGDHAQAEQFAQESLRFAHLSLPPGSPIFAAAWNNLAQACRFQAKYMEAEKNYRQAITAWENSLGPSHPFVAQGLMNMASFYHERGREAGAEDLYLRAVGILERAYGKEDPRTLEARNELAEVLRAERRFTESEKLGRTTLTGLERTLGKDDPRVIRAQSNFTRLQASRAVAEQQ